MQSGTNDSEPTRSTASKTKVVQKKKPKILSLDKAPSIQPKSTKSKPKHSATAESGLAATPSPAQAVPTPGMIATAAYFLAEQRRFAPGHELEDWLAAEQQIKGPPNNS
jgi:hypothetical protein